MARRSTWTYISFLLWLHSELAMSTALHRHDEYFLPDAVLRVTARSISQSCTESKSTVVVNGTSPGPEIRISEGQTSWIRVYNDMTDQNLTMHWHGLSMAAAPFSDGTPSASQWPIPPLHFFDYELNVPKGMAGTYFYHSHVGFQAVSAAGPLIVEDSVAPPYHYDEERILLFSDVYSKSDADIVAGLVANTSSFSWSGEIDMLLMNGRGGGVSNLTFCNSSLSSIDVEPNKTYRLRFIGATAITLAKFAVQDHASLEIIEADGAYTEPHNTSFIQIGPGQRFSALLRTKKIAKRKSYYIQAASYERPTVTTSYAILNYRAGAEKFPRAGFPPANAPLSLGDIDRNFLDYDLRPLHGNQDFPKASDVTRRVTMTVKQFVENMYTWRVNSLAWTESFPREPYLVSLYKNDGLEYPSLARAIMHNGSDPVTNAFPAELGEVLEIVIQNTGGGLYAGALDVHPFHAHGTHYWNLGAGPGTYNASENEAKWKSTHGVPVTRDTTMLFRDAEEAPEGSDVGWRAWRLRVTQPGVWMIHCHTLQHMVMGMQTVWVMGNASEVLTLPRPEVEGYLTYGGSVYGNETHWPSLVHVDDDWATNQ